MVPASQDFRAESWRPSAALRTPHPTRGDNLIKNHRHPSHRFTAVAAALAAGRAIAIEIDTGNPDLAMRWDNTVRLNCAQRAEARDPRIGNSALADEGDYSFDKGRPLRSGSTCCPSSMSSTRSRFGARLSAAA